MNSRLKVSLVIGLFFSLLVGRSALAEVIDIDNGELDKLVASGVPLIDIRTSPEWLETGIVAKSHLLTFFDEQGRANPPAWLEKARSIAKPGDPVIVICRSGNRTKAVSRFLSDQGGYAKVYNVKSGIAAWSREGRALTPVSQTMVSCRSKNTC